MSRVNGFATKRRLSGDEDGICVNNEAERPQNEENEILLTLENEEVIIQPGSATTIRLSYYENGKKDEVILKKVRGYKVSDLKLPEHVNGPVNCKNNSASGSVQLPENISGNTVDCATQVVPNTAMLACKYYDTGCRVTLEQVKREHELSCEFRPCFCPDISCIWQGSMEEVIPHLMVSHKSVYSLDEENVTLVTVDIKRPGAPCWVNILSCFGVNFLLVLKKLRRYGNPMFFAVIQMIGTRKDAEKFIYRVELKKQKQTLAWEAVVCSVQESVDIIVNTASMSFDATTARHFAHNDHLDIHTTITKV